MQKQDNLYAIFKLNQTKLKPYKQNTNFIIKKQTFLLGRMALILTKSLRQTMLDLKPTIDNSCAVSTQDSPTNYASPRSAIISSHTQEAQITKRRVDSQSPMLRRPIILKSTSMGGHEPSTKHMANSNALHKSEKQKSSRIMTEIHRLNNLNTQNDTYISNEDVDYQAQFRSLNEEIYTFMTRYRTHKSRDPAEALSLVVMDDWDLTKWFSMGMGAALLFLAFTWMFMKIFVFVI